MALERNGGGEEEGEGEEDLHGVGEGDRSGRSWRFLRCCRCRGGGSGTDTGRERAGFVFWDLACFDPPPPPQIPGRGVESIHKYRPAVSAARFSRWHGDPTIEILCFGRGFGDRIARPSLQRRPLYSS